MALVNAILVRYATGYTWVTDATSVVTHGRREGFLSLGSASTSAEAARTAQVVLDQHSAARVAVSAGMEPAGGDVPYVDFAVADNINAPDEAGSAASMRVMALTVSEDDEGNPIFVPELQTLSQALDQRLSQTLKALANGSLGGSTLSASPAPLTGTGVSSDPTGSWTGSGVVGPTGGAGSVGVVSERIVACLFTYGDETTPVVAATSVPVPIPVRMEVYQAEARLKTAGSTSTVATIRKSGVALSPNGTATLLSTETSKVASLTATTFTPGTDSMSVANTAGAGAKGLSVLVLGKVLA